MRAAQTFQNKPTDHTRGIMKLGNSTHHTGECIPYWGQASSRKQSQCGRHGLSNILKLQATFLYSIYHQRVGKTNLFHMRGCRFHVFNTWCTFNTLSLSEDISRAESKPEIPRSFEWPNLWRSRAHIYHIALCNNLNQQQTCSIMG